MRTIFESKRTWEGYGVEEFTKAIDEMIKFYTKGSDIIDIQDTTVMRNVSVIGDIGRGIDRQYKNSMRKNEDSFNKFCDKLKSFKAEKRSYFAIIAILSYVSKK